MIVNTNDISQNIDVVSCIFMSKIALHSLFQRSVKALDDGRFNIRIASYSKMNVAFFQKFMCWPRDKFFAFVRLQVYGYSSFAFREHALESFYYAITRFVP